MQLRPVILLALCLLLIPVSTAAQSDAVPGGLTITFQDSDNLFSQQTRTRIEAIARPSEREVRALLPDLPERIQLLVSPIDRSPAIVGGVTGWDDSPATVVVMISTSFEGGVYAAAETGLAPVLYHEFHHLARGWTIKGNRFGPGIAVAAVNEGLANVFSEIYTNTAFAGNAYPDNVASWWEEIRALPVDANYGHWMVEHPDGRQAIGYKTGSYIIRELLAASQLSILEPSALPIEQIFSLIDEIEQGC